VKAVRAVVAGMDAVLMSPPDAAFEALQAAVKSGRISKARLDSSVRRILQAKARLGLHSNRLVDVNALNQKFASIAWQKEAQEISDRGVTLLRDTPHRLPLDATKSSRALLLALYADPEPYPGEDLERELRARFDSLTTLRADTRLIGNAGILETAAAGFLRCCDSRFVCARERSQRTWTSPRRSGAMNNSQNWKPSTTVGLRSPYLIESFRGRGMASGIWHQRRGANFRGARAVRQIPVRGHLPVTIQAEF
jgi:beta-N-acetylhexosaminidase